MPDNKLSKNVNRAIKKAKSSSLKGGRKKYSRKKKGHVLGIIEGYDLLQYLIAVRPYIERKHKIDTETLEYLLFLFPHQYFTREDYRLIPKNRNKYISLKDLIENGWVEMVIKSAKSSDVFGFTDSTKHCIREFYEYLAGEKLIPEQGTHTNPFADPENKILDKARWNLMIRLRKEAKRRPSKYREVLFRPSPPPEIEPLDL